MPCLSSARLAAPVPPRPVACVPVFGWGLRLAHTRSHPTAQPASHTGPQVSRYFRSSVAPYHARYTRHGRGLCLSVCIYPTPVAVSAECRCAVQLYPRGSPAGTPQLYGAGPHGPRRPPSPHSGIPARRVRENRQPRTGVCGAPGRGTATAAPQTPQCAVEGGARTPVTRSSRGKHAPSQYASPPLHASTHRASRRAIPRAHMPFTQPVTSPALRQHRRGPRIARTRLLKQQRGCLCSGRTRACSSSCQRRLVGRRSLAT